MKEIPLSQEFYAIVDDECFEFINQFNWRVHKNPNSLTYYAMRSLPLSDGTITLHQELWYHFRGPIRDGYDIDHINQNGLDNRLENLRLATPQQNAANRSKVQSRKTLSQYKGVSKTHGRWAASIGFNGKAIHIGCFDTEEQAARAYDAKAKELFGDFAYCNFSSLPLADGTSNKT